MPRQDLKFRKYLLDLITDIDENVPQGGRQNLFREACASYLSEELVEILYRCPGRGDIIIDEFNRRNGTSISRGDEAKAALQERFTDIPTHRVLEIHGSLRSEALNEFEYARSGEPTKGRNNRYRWVCQGFLDYSPAEGVYEKPLPGDQLSLFYTDGEVNL